MDILWRRCGVAQGFEARGSIELRSQSQGKKLHDVFDVVDEVDVFDVNDAMTCRLICLLECFPLTDFPPPITFPFSRLLVHIFPLVSRFSKRAWLLRPTSR